jgi:hypothetical protein
MNTDELKRLHEAWTCGDEGAKQAFADFMCEHAQELLAMADENARLKERLERIEEIAGRETDATVALVSIGCIARWTDEEIAADYGMTGTALKEPGQ